MTNPGDSDQWWKQYGGTESQAPQPPQPPAASPPGPEVLVPPPAPGTASTVPPSAPLPPPYPQPGPQGYPGYQPYVYGQPQQSTNGLAIGSLVASLVGPFSCGLGSIVAIVLGIVALRQLRRSGEQGRGLALAGLCVGIGGLVLLLAYLVFIIIGASKGFS